MHSKKLASKEMINFQKNSTNSGSVNSEALVKAHGSLMTIAWMFLCSSGILFSSILSGNLIRMFFRTAINFDIYFHSKDISNSYFRM